MSLNDFLSHNIWSAKAADKHDSLCLSVYMRERQRDRQTDRQTDSQTDRQTDRWGGGGQSDWSGRSCLTMKALGSDHVLGWRRRAGVNIGSCSNSPVLPQLDDG